MRRAGRLWIIGYREWSILALGGLFPVIGVLMLSESSDATSTATGVSVIAAGLFIVWWGTRRNVAIASGSGVRMICRLPRDRWIPREEIRSVRLVSGGESVFSACAVTLVTSVPHERSALFSESMTWKGGTRRGTRLAETLRVPLETDRGNL